MKRGFTLIELLVVVLIIGILSSVALPQYTKSVNKAKASEAWSYARSFFDAQERYYMANGEFTDDLESLDITLGEMKNWEINRIELYSKNDVRLSLTPNFNIKDFHSFRYTIWIENGKLKHTIHCAADTAACMPLLPCLGVGSGSYGAGCEDWY